MKPLYSKILTATAFAAQKLDCRASLAVEGSAACQALLASEDVITSLVFKV